MAGAATPLRTLVGRVSLYTVARAAAGVVRVLTLPFIVHAVSPTAFGTLATLWMPVIAMHMLCDLGLGTAAVRLAPECAGADEKRSLLSTMMFVRVAASVLVTGGLVLFREPLASWITGSPGNGRAFAVLVLSRPFAMMAESASDGFRAQGEWRKVASVVFLGACMAQGASVVLTVGYGLGLEGLVWARVVSDVSLSVFALSMSSRSFRAAPRARYLRPLLAFGWPLGSLLVLGSLRGLDRPLLGAWASLEDVASYELGARLVGPVGVFNIAVGIVLEPFLYEHAGSRGLASWIDRYVRAYVTAFAAISMALSVAGPELIALLAPEAYRGAARVLPPLAFALTCEGLQRAAGVGAELAMRTRVWALASLATLVTGLGLGKVAVAHFGIAGLGLAWTLSIVLGTLIVYRVAREVSGIVVPMARALFVILAGALLGTLAAWHPWPLGLRLVLLVVYGFAAYRVMGVRWSELREAL